MPPNTHLSNVAERAIHNFKAHFISVLAGVDPDFTRNLWQPLLTQTEVTLNLLRQETLDPSISEWAYFHGPFNYDTILLVLLGCHIISHKNTGIRNLWDFCGASGWNVGVSIHNYRCHTIVAKATKSVQVLETVELQHHHYLTLTYLTPDDRIFHGVTKLACALRDSPAIACDNQLAAIQALRQAIKRWTQTTLPSPIQLAPVPPPPPTPKQCHSILRPMHCQAPLQPPASLPRVFTLMTKADLSAPRVPSTQEKDEPIARHNRSKVTHTVDPQPPRVEKATDPGLFPGVLGHKLPPWPM